MSKLHRYEIVTEWTGNRGTGTSGYRTYARDHLLKAEGKPAIEGSSDPAFRGDAARYNPEDLLVASLSACHMLWFLHLCAEAGIVVATYSDAAAGFMEEASDGGGQFTEVVLRPQVTLADGDEAAIERTAALHDAAHAKCFIARSVNFPVRHTPVTRLAAAAAGR